jgi:hypothetical protein
MSNSIGWSPTLLCLRKKLSSHSHGKGEGSPRRGVLQCGGRGGKDGWVRPGTQFSGWGEPWGPTRFRNTSTLANAGAIHAHRHERQHHTKTRPHGLTSVVHTDAIYPWSSPLPIRLKVLCTRSRSKSGLNVVFVDRFIVVTYSKSTERPNQRAIRTD